MILGIDSRIFYERFLKRTGIKLHQLPKLKNYKSGTLRCCYCNKVMQQNNYTREHMIPVCKYGNNSIHNVKPCCKACNVGKANRDIHDYIKYLNGIPAMHWKIENVKRAFYGNLYEIIDLL